VTAFVILRRPIGASASRNEFYDDFDCLESILMALIRCLRAADPDWWYLYHEGVQGDLGADKRRYW
jgi:hypothetical protein